MPQTPSTEYLAECFWPGVTVEDLRRLDERVVSAAAVAHDGQVVRYLGSLLMRDDEVVLCRFEGAEVAASPWTGEHHPSGEE